jgi:GNAT superfamily N-acetyltransferase
MVFWKSYPITNILRSKFNNDIFKDLQFERDNIQSPTGVVVKILDRNNMEIVREVKTFLKVHFGNPPKTPVLDIPEDKICDTKDILMYVRDIDGKIVGCIRYHYMGICLIGKNRQMFCEDCFCIHPFWRKKGVGDYLLTKLHRYVNKNKIPYSMFLKEGAQLSIINTPLYSSIYVYRKVFSPNITNVVNLSVQEAYKLMDIFCEFSHNIFIVRNKDNTNQYWRLYKNHKCKILVCVQDTYQRFEKDGKSNKMGWITAWIESSNVTDNCREEASKQITDSMINQFDYVWGNKEWIGNSNEWEIDGQFHWYSYQWATNINIKKSYCILN